MWDIRRRKALTNVYIALYVVPSIVRTTVVHPVPWSHGGCPYLYLARTDNRCVPRESHLYILIEPHELRLPVKAPGVHYGRKVWDRELLTRPSTIHTGKKSGDQRKAEFKDKELKDKRRSMKSGGQRKAEIKEKRRSKKSGDQRMPRKNSLDPGKTFATALPRSPFPFANCRACLCRTEELRLSGFGRTSRGFFEIRTPSQDAGKPLLEPILEMLTGSPVRVGSA